MIWIWNSFYYAANFFSSGNAGLLLVQSWSCDLNGGFSLVDSPTEFFFNVLAFVKEIIKNHFYNELFCIMIFKKNHFK